MLNRYACSVELLTFSDLSLAIMPQVC